MINLSEILGVHGQGCQSDFIGFIRRACFAVLLFCTLNLIERAILCQVLPEILSPEMSCLSQVSAMILQRVTRCVKKEKLCLSLSCKTAFDWLQDSSYSA